MGLQLAARYLPPSEVNATLAKLRSVIRHAHVAAKNDQDHFASADAKVCDAGACFLPVWAENAAGVGCWLLRDWGVGLFAAGRGKCGMGIVKTAAAFRSGRFYVLLFRKTRRTSPVK